MNNLTTWFLNSENQQVSENITDVPPITFNSNGKPLTNWKITGSQNGVGDKTDNLFNVEKATQGYKIYIPLGDFDENDPLYGLITSEEDFVSDYIMCDNLEKISFDFASFITTAQYQIDFNFFDENKNFLETFSEIATHLYPGGNHFTANNISIPNDAKYFRFSMEKNFYNIMLTGTSTSQSYELYGYKIPIECGNTITNIYIDEPLYEEDSIGYKDTKVTIPTIDGENELSIGTINAPTSVFIQTNGVSQGFRDYFKAQMMINND